MPSAECRVDFNTSRLKLCAFVMAFATPIAGAVMLMVALMKSILFLSPKTGYGPVDFRYLVLCSVNGVVLIVSGFILLIGLIKGRTKWIFWYLVLSTPSLLFLMWEVVFIVFLEFHFKIFMIVSTSFMLCDQLCVLGYFVLIVRRRRTERMENLIIYYEDGYFRGTVSRDHCFDSTSI